MEKYGRTQSAPTMMFDPKLHHRHSIRLKGYDYSNHGAYFVTICSYEKKCLFGAIVGGKMVLNDLGKIVETEWIKSGEMRKDVVLYQFVVMPNHFHGIVLLTRDIVGADCVRPHSPADSVHPKLTELGKMVAGFKSAVSSKLKKSGFIGDVWQRNYYEHIIRNEEELISIVQYTEQNPLNWLKDSLYSVHEAEK